MLSIFKPAAERLLKPLAYPLRRINPNVITCVGAVFPVLFFVCVVRGMLIAALAVLVLSAADMLDGLVARAQNRVTAFGGFLDSTADRFSDFVVLVAFGYSGIVGWNIVLPLVLLTYLISYIRSRTELAAGGKLKADVGIMERTERLVALFAGLLAYAIWPHITVVGYNLMICMFAVLIVLSAVTVAQRVHFAYRHL